MCEKSEGDLMMMDALLRATALAALMSTSAAAQTAADPHHPETLTQAEQPAAPAQPESAAPGSMGQGIMGQGMMGQGMMGAGMGQMRMMGHGHAMKIMFAIADGD